MLERDKKDQTPEAKTKNGIDESQGFPESRLPPWMPAVLVFSGVAGFCNAFWDSWAKVHGVH